MTEEVLQEIFWMLLRDICIFRKMRIHNSYLGENADSHQSLFCQGNIRYQGVSKLTSCGIKAKRSKEKEIISPYFLFETHTISKCEKSTYQKNMNVLIF